MLRVLIAALAIILASPSAFAANSLVLIRGVYPAGPRSDWFNSLIIPGTQAASCCNVSDCHQTSAKQAVDGHWQAILPDTGAWIDVPPEKVLKHPLSIDGEAYICSLGSTVYCMVPPIPGY